MEIERDLFYLINHHLANPFFDLSMPLITDSSVLLLLPPFIYILYRYKRKALILLFLLLIGLLLSDGISHLLKKLIERPRPFSVLDNVRLLVGMGKSFAMPSGHATNVFTAATLFALFSKRLTRKEGLIVTVYVYSLAFTVAFSRVYLGVHWVSDVLVGAVLGVAIGLCIFYIFYYLVEKRSYSLLLLLSLVALSIFRFYFVAYGPFDLSPDEAHYWDWSRHLQLCYYSKGPLVAYLIRAGTMIFGDTEIGVRAPAIVLFFLSSLVLYRLTMTIAREAGLSGQRAILSGILSVAMLQIIPLFSAYSIIMTIDAPLIFSWLLGLYLFRITLTNPSNITIWSVLGVVLGLGLLSKFTMAFFFFSALVYILISDRRDILRSSNPWFAFGISLLIFSPVILWNAQNGWVTFRHTAGHLNLKEGLSIKPLMFLEFVGSQLGVLTPVGMLLFLALWENRREGFLLSFSLPVLLFFLFKSLQGKVQANWALPGYLVLLPWGGVYLIKNWQAWRRGKIVLLASLLVSLFILLVAHYPPLWGVPPRFDPTARLRGWKELGFYVSKKLQRMDKSTFLFSDTYQVTAELAFYVVGKPRVYCARIDRRLNQYDLWEGFYDRYGDDAIFVKRGKKFPKEVSESFEDCQIEMLYVLEREWILKDYLIAYCKDFKGMKVKPPESY